MKTVEITMREITERTETMQVTDEEFEAIMRRQVGISPNSDRVSNKLWDMSDMDDFNNAYFDYEIIDKDTENILIPFEA